MSDVHLKLANNISHPSTPQLRIKCLYKMPPAVNTVEVIGTIGGTVTSAAGCHNTSDMASLCTMSDRRIAHYHLTVMKLYIRQMINKKWQV
ncbi:hypothetical protein ACHAXN_013513 [Cyclotella atomus]